MFKNISITSFIHTAFAITFIALITAFVLFLQYDKKVFNTQKESRYQLIASGFLSNLDFLETDRDMQRLFDHYRVRSVDDNNLRVEILTQGEVIFFRERFDSRVRVFNYDGKFYIYIQQLGFNLMLEDMKSKSYNAFIAFFLFAGLFTVFLLLYFFIIKKLLPLKQLNRRIQQFGQGKTDTVIEIDGNDEIAKISKSFAQAVKNINSLIASKNLFMKNFMHELKTPIAKGKISVALLPPSKDRQILTNVFDRMDVLVKHIATIEKAKMSILNKKRVSVKTLLQYSKTVLDVTPKLHEQVEDFTCYVDEQMMVIVLKNLIENGYNYGDGEVWITVKANKIEICNRGKELDKPLQHYSEAFIKNSQSSGLGLGLYLCQSILQLHKSKLQYSYSEGKNCFSFNLPPQN